jgi:Fasciclin domain
LFGTLCSLVVNADLAGVLSSTDSDFTVFAPTNAAFEAISAVVPTLTPEQVKDILLFHVIAGKEVFAANLTCGGHVEMANGGVTVTLCQDGHFFQTGAGNTLAPKIITADIDVCNGVIHVIDNVILPTLSTSAMVEPTSLPTLTPTALTAVPTALPITPPTQVPSLSEEATEPEVTPECICACSLPNSLSSSCNDFCGDVCSKEVNADKIADSAEEPPSSSPSAGM